MKQNIIDIKTGNILRINTCKPRNQNDQTLTQQNEYYNFTQCSICCEDMFENMSVLVPCGHVFHSKCLQEYQKLECPFCRGQNQQAIKVHFSIESKQNQSKKPIQQNKFFQNNQSDFQKNNKEFYQNLRILVSKGKESIDKCYNENIWKNWNSLNDKQKLNSCESLYKEISNIFANLRKEIDNQNYPDNKEQLQNQFQSPQVYKNHSKLSQEAFQKIYFDQNQPILNLDNINSQRYNQNQQRKPQNEQNKLSNKTHIFNKYE